MTPPETPSGVMVVFFLVGEGVVVAVQANPLNGSALARERAAEEQKVLQPLGRAKAAVRDESVPSHSDSEAAGDEVE